jgi:signal transduction histidine kinase
VSYTSELLENLLYWSKSQLKGETISPSLFPLYDIVEHIRLFFEKRLKDKSIILTNHIQQPCMVYADMEMMRIVIRNLVSNAIKFTPKNGRIDITAEEKGNTIQVQIKDTGVGIEDKDETRLFSEEIFTSRGTDNEIGTGLGLLLCKEFIEKNNGRISYSPNQPSGSIFTFDLRSL